MAKTERKSKAKVPQSHKSAEFVGDSNSDEATQAPSKITSKYQKSVVAAPVTSRPSQTPIPFPGQSSKPYDAAIRTKSTASAKKERVTNGASESSKPAASSADSKGTKRLAAVAAPIENTYSESASESSSPDSSESEKLTSSAPDNVRSTTKVKENVVDEPSEDESAAAEDEIHQVATNGTNSDAHESEDEDERMSDATDITAPDAAETELGEVGVIQPLQPPPGFCSIDMSKSTAAPSVQSLLESRGSGKQIWYISAPANVPMSKIAELSIDKLNKSGPLIEHNGNAYKAIRDEQQEKITQTLQPEKSAYKLSKSKLYGILSLQHYVALPQTSAGNPSTRKITSTVSAGRKQPKGLRMRFRPSGYAQNDDNEVGWTDSDNDEDDRNGLSRPSQSFIAPPSLNATSKPSKRKLNVADESQTNPSKKTKKEGKRHDEKKKSKSKKVTV